MKRTPIHLSQRAQQDFIDILRYTGETWGKAQLQTCRDKLDDALQALSSNPQIGHRRTDLPDTPQAYLVGAHIIVYRMRGNAVGIVRILHQRMSLGKHV